MPTTPHSRVIAVLLAAVVLIGGANLAAYAANGQPLLLGKTNVETKPSTVKNTGSGPALSLKTKPGKPPLQVNRSSKVKKLNADLLDGTNAAALTSKGHHYDVASTAASNSHRISFPGLPARLYLMTYSIISRNGGDVLCVTTGSRQALSYASSLGTFDTNNASAIVDTTGGAETLDCSGGASLELYSTSGDAVSEVNFMRLDQVTAGTPTTTRHPARPDGGAATRR